MLAGEDFNAQVGANDEPDAIDSKYVGRHSRDIQNSRGQRLRHSAVQQQLTLANTFFKKQDHRKATYHSTEHCKQLDNVLMNRALFIAKMQKQQSRLNSDKKDDA